MAELHFARRAIEDAQATLAQVDRDELQIVVRARADALKTFEQLGPRFRELTETVQGLLAANAAQIERIQDVMRRLLDSMQPQMTDIFALAEKMREAYPPFEIPQYILLPPTLPARVEYTERTEEPMVTGTASLTEATGIEEAADPTGMDWLMDELLQENDAQREMILNLRAEVGMWKLGVFLDATIPYPDLDAEDFDRLERQP